MKLSEFKPKASGLTNCQENITKSFVKEEENKCDSCGRLEITREKRNENVNYFHHIELNPSKSIEQNFMIKLWGKDQMPSGYLVSIKSCAMH